MLWPQLCFVDRKYTGYIILSVSEMAYVMYCYVYLYIIGLVQLTSIHTNCRTQLNLPPRFT